MTVAEVGRVHSQFGLHLGYCLGVTHVLDHSDGVAFGGDQSPREALVKSNEGTGHRAYVVCVCVFVDDTACFTINNWCSVGKRESTISRYKNDRIT